MPHHQAGDGRPRVLLISFPEVIHTPSQSHLVHIVGDHQSCVGINSTKEFYIHFIINYLHQQWRINTVPSITWSQVLLNTKDFLIRKLEFLNQDKNTRYYWAAIILQFCCNNSTNLFIWHIPQPPIPPPKKIKFKMRPALVWWLYSWSFSFCIFHFHIVLQNYSFWNSIEHVIWQLV